MKADTFVTGLTLCCTSLFWVIVFRNHDFLSVELRYISWFVPSSKVFVLDCSSAPCSLKPHSLRCTRRQLCWIWDIIDQTLFCQGLGVVLSFFFFIFAYSETSRLSLSIDRKKRTRSISNNLDRTSWLNKGIFYIEKTTLFSCRTVMQRVISSGPFTNQEIWPFLSLPEITFKLEIRTKFINCTVTVAKV